MSNQVARNSRSSYAIQDNHLYDQDSLPRWNGSGTLDNSLGFIDDAGLLTVPSISAGSFSASSLLADTIDEATLNAGVTVEGVLLRDNSIDVPGSVDVRNILALGQGSIYASKIGNVQYHRFWNAGDSCYDYQEAQRNNNYTIRTVDERKNMSLHGMDASGNYNTFLYNDGTHNGNIRFYLNGVTVQTDNNSSNFPPQIATGTLALRMRGSDSRVEIPIGLEANLIEGLSASDTITIGSAVMTSGNISLATNKRLTSSNLSVLNTPVVGTDCINLTYFNANAGVFDQDLNTTDDVDFNRIDVGSSFIISNEMGSDFIRASNTAYINNVNENTPSNGILFRTNNTTPGSFIFGRSGLDFIRINPADVEFQLPLNIDTIQEFTGNNGVSVDGVLLKDNKVLADDVSYNDYTTRFESYAISGLAIPSNTETQLTNWTTSTGSLGGFDPVTGIWTCPSDGIYSFGFFTGITTASGTSEITCVIRNNVGGLIRYISVLQSSDLSAPAYEGAVTFTAINNFVTTDVVNINVELNANETCDFTLKIIKII